MAEGDRLIPMDAEAIREWRANPKPGHTRHGYAFKGPGRGGVSRDDPVHDPDQSPDAFDPSSEQGYVDGDVVSMSLPPLPAGIEEPRRARDEYERRVLAWVRKANKTAAGRRQIREIAQARVAILKATSPVQFSHIKDASLEEQLIRFLNAKSQAAVERVYSRRGWTKPQDFDLVRSDAPATEAKSLLPGQIGRGT